jgi:hypothetical protein
MPNVIMLSVVMLSVIMLSVVMLSVVMLSVVMLNIVTLSVVASSNHRQQKSNTRLKGSSPADPTGTGRDQEKNSCLVAMAI